MHIAEHGFSRTISPGRAALYQPPFGATGIRVAFGARPPHQPRAHTGQLKGLPVLALMTLLCFAAQRVHADERDGEAMRWMAQGHQIYRCSQDGGRAGWVLERPEAVLKDQGGAVKADHGAGPVWRATDGSEVQGVVVTTIPAPKVGALSWLVLRVSRHAGHGMLDRVAYVLRTDTDGGVAPETGCDASQSGRQIAIPYRATYTFIAGLDLPAAK